MTLLERTPSHDRIAGEALRDPSAAVVEWHTETISHPFGTPTTESIERVRGVALATGERRAFTAIAKTVRSIRYFPPVSALPLEVHGRRGAAVEGRARGLRVRAPRILAA